MTYIGAGYTVPPPFERRHLATRSALPCCEQAMPLELIYFGSVGLILYILFAVISSAFEFCTENKQVLCRHDEHPFTWFRRIDCNANAA